MVNQIANVQISTKTIITAAERAAKVVFALKTYARYDSIGEKLKANPIDGIETTKPAGEGSGLGLDIVRKIVEKHQGQIAVKSIPGKTTFTVYLPIDR